MITNKDFFDDLDDLLNIKEENPKPARKEAQRATTMMDFNTKPHFNNDSSELPKSSSYSNRFQQGQYNSSQVNYFSGVQDDNNTDEETHKKFGMTGMTIQTTISKNDDALRQYEPPKSAGSPQVGANFRKTFADIGSLEEKDDDDVDIPFSRRNVRRSTYKDQTTTNQDNGDRFKGSSPAFGGFQQNTALGKKDNLNQLSQLDELDGSSQFQQGNKTSFGGSLQFDKGSKQPIAQEKKNLFSNQESDDAQEELGGYNPSSVSRVASARRTRQRETNNGSSPNSMNNTKTNNKPSFSASQNFQESQQQYPRLMKQPEEQAQIPNESGANRFARSQQVGKNESSYISDKDFLGGSETKEVENAIDDEIHIDNKFSRRSSSHRGADNSKHSQPPKPNYISNQQDNQFSQQLLTQAQPSFQQQAQTLSLGIVSQQSFPANNQQDAKTANELEVRQIEANAKETLKMLKQLEEEKKLYKEQISKEQEENTTKLRKIYEDQIAAIKESYEELLKFERQRNFSQQAEVQELIKKDRERERQLNEMDTANLKQLFEKEKQQMEAAHNLQIDSLKKLLQKQSETAALEDQLKMRSDKLATIQNQIEGAVSKNQVDMHAQIEETQEKQKYLNDLEKSLLQQKEFIEADKKRVEKQKANLIQFAESQREQLEKEKEVVLKEYKRINEMQEQIKELEAAKKKESLNERRILEAEKLECQEERLRLKQEFEQLYRNFEARVEAFEKTKEEFEKGQGKIDSFQDNRVRAVEGRHMEVLRQEQYVMQKLKALELRELELNRREQEEALIFARAKQQQITCELEKKNLLHLAEDIKNEGQMTVDFRSNFQLERTKILQKEQELQERERQINKRQSQVLSEKREVSLLHQTLRELKQQQISSSSSAKHQINYTSPSSKSYSDYQPSQTQFQFRSPGLKNANNPFRLSEYKSLNTRSANSLKQFNFGSRPIELEDPQQTHKNELNDYCKGQIQNKFDIRGFLNDVKELDRKQIENINYISLEKDNLLNYQMSKQRIPTFSLNEFQNDEVASQLVASVHENNQQRQSISNFFGAQN